MPIQTFMSDGYTPIFDSDVAGDGVCLGAYSVPAGQGFYKQFALLAGTQIQRLNSWGFDLDHRDAGDGISYPGSIPTCSLSPVAFVRMFTLWATGQPTIQNAAGGQALSPTGGVALSPAARGLNFIGKATFNRWEGVPDNHPYSAPANVDFYRIESATPPTFVLRLYSDSAVSVAAEAHQIGASTWEIGVTRTRLVYAPGHNSAFNLPLDIYCFATPSAPLTNPEFSIRDTDDGTLAYDLMRPILAAQQIVHFGASTLSVSTGGVGSVVGVIGTPRQWQDIWTYQGDEQDGSPGLMFRDQNGGAWVMSGSALRIEFVWRDHAETTLGYTPPPSVYDAEPVSVPLINLTGF